MLDFSGALRLALVYVHLIACAISLGTVVRSEICMLHRVLTGKNNHFGVETNFSKRIVPAALVTLWLTGLFFIQQDARLSSLEQTLSNPKLQGKLIVVAVLTLNGLVLHWRVFPLLERVQSLAELRLEQRLLAVEAGTLSTVSWLYAAFLGVARPLAWKFSLQTLLVVYPILTSVGFFIAWLLVCWGMRRRRSELQAAAISSSSQHATFEMRTKIR